VQKRGHSGYKEIPDAETEDENARH